MASRKKLSHDQKRKKKLAERNKARGLTGNAVTPYEGQKYKEPEYADVLFRTECGIREADEISQRSLTDRQVEASLDLLVRQLRGETSTPSTDLIGSRIRAHWAECLPSQPFRLSNDDLTGILRTLLGSVRVRTRMTPGGRGYLEYLTRFLAKLGFNARSVSPEELLELEGGAPEPLP
jgi:hypothetical protein